MIKHFSPTLAIGHFIGNNNIIAILSIELKPIEKVYKETKIIAPVPRML